MDLWCLRLTSKSGTIISTGLRQQLSAAWTQDAFHKIRIKQFSIAVDTNSVENLAFLFRDYNVNMFSFFGDLYDGMVVSCSYYISTFVRALYLSNDSNVYL